MPPPYVIDTSIWIRISDHHPPDIFTRLWDQLRASIHAGHLLSPEEVLHELRRGTDDLAERLSGEAGLFQPLSEDVQIAVGIVMGVRRPRRYRGRAKPSRPVCRRSGLGARRDHCHR